MIERLRKSDHLDLQWKRKLGVRAPTINEVHRLIRESVRIQKFTVLYTLRGARVKILALYYHRGRDLFLKVDWLTQRVVTVVPGRQMAEVRDQRSEVIGQR